jgi:hypothetical protein
MRAASARPPLRPAISDSDRNRIPPRHPCAAPRNLRRTVFRMAGTGAMAKLAVSPGLETRPTANDVIDE